PVMSSPDNMKENSIGYLAYFKPGAGLTLLREQILGPERFDLAFRAYVERWGFKHPTPDDFFRTMENVSGEDLGWFWRGWFLNNWKLDQAVTDVKYVKNDAAKGALITVSNLEKMAMPVILEIKTKSGKTDRVKLPVEVWQRNNRWTFVYPSTEEIVSVTSDPDKVLPDGNPGNNVFKTSNETAAASSVNLDPYLGTYSNTKNPLKIVITKEGSTLMAQAGDQPPFPLETIGKDKFKVEEAGVELQFDLSKKEMTMSANGDKSLNILFTKDK
ncbi:MAG: hypothetical protein WBP45_10425, partial [Daejeonella sp.]